jgi:hypothetical protein
MPVFKFIAHLRQRSLQVRPSTLISPGILHGWNAERRFPPPCLALWRHSGQPWRVWPWLQAMNSLLESA